MIDCFVNIKLSSSLKELKISEKTVINVSRVLKTLLHMLLVEEMQHADWLICLVWIQDGGITTNLLLDKLRVWWKTSNKAKIFCSKLTQQRSSTRNKCFCCATSWSRKVKNEKHRPKTWNDAMLRDKFRVLNARAKWCNTERQSKLHHFI